MNKKILATVIFFIALSSFAFSQDNNMNNKYYYQDGQKYSSDEMLSRDMNMFQTELNLTSSEETAVRQILQKAYQRMDMNYQGGKKSRDDMNTIWQDRDNTLKSVLTEDQWSRYNSLGESKRNTGYYNSDNDKTKSP